MSTAAQVTANRENAQHSTGPKTPEGKNASPQNAVRNGFNGRFAVLESEDATAFETLLNSLRDEHQPSTTTEHILVDRIAQHLWLSQRAQHLQDQYIETDEKRFSLYMRYQATNDRAFHKCLSDLLKLRAEKRKVEIGFVSQKAKEAEAAAKTELAEARARQANAKAAHQELETEIKGTIEARLPGFDAIPFDSVKVVLASALEQVAKKAA